MAYALVCPRFRTQAPDGSEVSVMDGSCVLAQAPGGDPDALANLMASFCSQSFFPEAEAAFGAAFGAPSCLTSNSGKPGSVPWKIELKACARAPSYAQAEAAAGQLQKAAAAACAAELERLGIPCLAVNIPPALLLDERCHAEAERHAGFLLAMSEKNELQKGPQAQARKTPRAKF